MNPITLEAQTVTPNEGTIIYGAGKVAFEELNITAEAGRVTFDGLNITVETGKITHRNVSKSGKS